LTEDEHEALAMTAELVARLTKELCKLSVVEQLTLLSVVLVLLDIG
jgi:hypothetical protein